jgi:hypothetical protein
MKPLPRLVVFFLASVMGIFIWWLMKPGKMGIPFYSYSIAVNVIALFVSNFFILGFMRPHVFLGLTGFTVGQIVYLTFAEPSDALFILGLAIVVFISIVISSISYIIFFLIQFLRELISEN